MTAVEGIAQEVGKAMTHALHAAAEAAMLAAIVDGYRGQIFACVGFTRTGVQIHVTRSEGMFQTSAQAFSGLGLAPVQAHIIDVTEEGAQQCIAMMARNAGHVIGGGMPS